MLAIVNGTLTNGVLADHLLLGWDCCLSSTRGAIQRPADL
jgi:hypothetical protein